MSSGTHDSQPATEPRGTQRPARHHEFVIVGGGAGGLSVASRLCRAVKGADVAIVEPSEEHCYQPLWTLVGAGVVSAAKTRRAERDLIPKGATWIHAAVTEFRPAESTVVLSDGTPVSYDYLVVAVGIQLNWDQIDGLEGNLGRNGICSNYLVDQCEGTWKAIQATRSGNAVFTMPPPPIKCAGAPQKICYLAEDHWRRTGVRDGLKVHYFAGTPGIFSVKAFAKTLNEVIARKEIVTHYKHRLTAVDADARVATFSDTETGEETPIEYSMLHVTPPQSSPDVVKRSPLADEAGWVKVDKHTLQHPDHPNVFSLGDASSLPTSKTGAAIRKQAPVLVQNMLAQRAGAPLEGSYDGYASCPLTTGYGKLVLAEFDYDLEPAPSFPFDTTKERRSMYQMKRHLLPRLYWQGMLKGRA